MSLRVLGENATNTALTYRVANVSAVTTEFNVGRC